NVKSESAPARDAAALCVILSASKDDTKKSERPRVLKSLKSKTMIDPKFFTILLESPCKREDDEYDYRQEAVSNPGRKVLRHGRDQKTHGRTGPGTISTGDAAARRVGGRRQSGLRAVRSRD